MTDRQLVLKSGSYGCCGCCCWNEMTKSVPLEKITDLSIKQGCLQRCYNLKELCVETASASAAAPEMVLVGVIDPESVRKMVLRTRDNNGINGSDGRVNIVAAYNPNIGGGGGIADNSSTQQLISVSVQQQQTLSEIKNLLVDVASGINNLNKTMGGKGNKNQYNQLIGDTSSYQ